MFTSKKVNKSRVTNFTIQGLLPENELIFSSEKKKLKTKLKKIKLKLNKLDRIIYMVS